MPEIRNDGMKISYEVAGEGRPLVLLHGWSGDRSSWTEPGYGDELGRDHHLVNVDVRGHGASGKPYDVAAYTWDGLADDVSAVAAADGMDRFSIWGQAMGGLIAWKMAATAPDRVATIVTTGAWDPRPKPKDPTASDAWVDELRQHGMRAWLEGETVDDESLWPDSVTLRADPEALIASGTAEMWTDGVIPEDDLGSCRVPALRFADEEEDESDDAGRVAATIRNGLSLRLPGIGHGASVTARTLTIPHARAFLDRWDI